MKKTSVRILAMVLAMLVVLSALATTFIFAEPSDETQSTQSSKTAALTVESEPDDTDLKNGENSTDITYTIKNTGEAEITDIVLKDSDIAGSKTIGSLDSLQPGSAKTFTYKATFTRSSTSSPVVTCKANGQSKTFTGASVQIKYQEGTGAKLSGTLSASKTNIAANEEVSFTLTIKNEGTSKVSDIAITDSKGVQLKSGISVSGNESTKVDFTAKVESSTDYVVTIKGEDESGAEISVASAALKITVDGEESEDTDPIKVTVEADNYKLSEKGEVNLTINIENTTDLAYSDIVITDQVSNAQLQEIDTLNPKQTRTLTTKVSVEENTSFEYKLVAKDASGNEISVTSNKVDIEVEGSGFSLLTAIIIALVVIVVLIIATGVSLFVLSKKEKKKNKTIGSEYSKKYKEPTPTKRAQEFERPRPKLSTFTISDEEPSTLMGEEPIQIPTQSGFGDEEFIRAAQSDDDNVFVDIQKAEENLMNPFEEEREEPQSTTIDFNDLDPDNF